MLIGIDASRANRDFKTGTEWYSYYLIKNLIEIDKKNKYVLYSDKELNSSFLKDLNLSENKHVKVKVLRWPFSFFWTLGRLSLEMIFHRPDVLFVPAHSLPLFFPKKTINTIHDIAFVNDESLYNTATSCRGLVSSEKTTSSLARIFTLGKYSSSASDYLKWSTKFALRKAKKIISVSHFTKNEILKNYKVKPDKIAVVHNGFVDSLYRENKDPELLALIKKKYGLNYPFFLFVGRLEKKKNIHRLIEGFALFKKANKEAPEKLVLVGKAGYGYDEMKYLIDEFNLENDVIILGWVDESDMPHIFNLAKVFVFPSLYEGFGIPILQAMSCAVPVLLSDLEVFLEVAGRDNAVFFDRFCPSDLAEKMKEINNNEDLRQKLIVRGKERVKNFSFKKCATETLAVIESL